MNHTEDILAQQTTSDTGKRCLVGRASTPTTMKPTAGRYAGADECEVVLFRDMRAVLARLMNGEIAV